MLLCPRKVPPGARKYQSRVRGAGAMPAPLVADLFRKYAEVVEVGDGVGQSAKADLSGARVAVVVALQDAAMVEIDLEAGAAQRNFQNAPVVGGNLVTRNRLEHSESFA